MVLSPILKMLLWLKKKKKKNYLANQNSHFTNLDRIIEYVGNIILK